MNKRLTDNEFHTKESKERACYIQEPRLQAIYDKLFDLEDIEEELGIDLIKFLVECKHVLEHSDMTTGITSKGMVIKTDFGYVADFIDGIKETLKKEELEK